MRHAARAKPSVAGVLAFAAAMTVAAMAHAHPWMGRGSWCTDLLGGAGYDCAFYSFEQCWATASGMSNYCTPNPLYVQPPARITRAQVRPKRHRPHH
jgi:Protein of unknown function (DUF3551)